MKKLSLVIAAGAIVLGLAGVTPTFAASLGTCQNDLVTTDGISSDAITQDAPAIVASLQAKGINAEDVSNWGGCIKADVVRSNGHVATEYFQPGSLQRLHVNG